MRIFVIGCLLASGLIGFATVVSAVEVRTPDDFQDGTTQGWRSGPENPNPPRWEPSGGPEGAGDGFLVIEASGLASSGGNLVAFNTDQWSGNYRAAGVVAIRAQLRNLGSSDLVIRLLFESDAGSFLSAAAAYLPAGGDWQFVVWPAAPFAEGEDGEAVLASVSKLRILHAPDGEGAEPLPGMLGVDNISALSGAQCLDAGLAREELNLCRVYCDWLDCEGSPRSATACGAIETQFEKRVDELPPCAQDADGDGWVDAVDSCPDDPDGDLADHDGDGVGDVCDNCPDDPNPDQASEVCSCPCFVGADIAGLIETLSDGSTYQDLACFDERPGVKLLTFVSAVRVDGAACGSDSDDCSVLAAEFTEDNACQYNPPAPAPQVLMGEISDLQRDNCRELILDEAEAAGLTCE